MKRQTFIIALITTGVLLTAACRKGRFDEVPEDDALFEILDQDAGNIADEAMAGNIESFRLASFQSDQQIFSHCASVTRDTVNKTVTVDFGQSGCTGHDGRVRKGIINMTYTGPLRDSGSVVTQTFQNFSVNDNRVTGTRVITNNGKNSAGNTTFTIVSDGAIELADDKGTVTRKSERVREWIQGEGTPERSDDIFSITGTAEGTSAEGINYSASTVKPLIRKIGCRHFTMGSLEILPEDKPKRTIDFGDGICDDLATLKVRNRTRTISLR